MTSMVGADIDELRSFARNLDQSAQSLRLIEAQIGPRVHSSPWAGDGAERFRYNWDQHHRKTLLLAADRLRSASIDVAAQADQQEITSSAGYTGSGVSIDALRDAERLRREQVDQRQVLELIKKVVTASLDSYWRAMLANMDFTVWNLPNIQDWLNDRLNGLGDLPLDVLGMFVGPAGVVGDIITWTADSERILRDFMKGDWDSLVGDAGNLIWDGVPIITHTVIGRLKSALDTGVDIGHMITDIPFIKDTGRTIADGIIDYGRRHNGGAVPNYDGFDGVVRLFGDFFGSIGL